MPVAFTVFIIVPLLEMLVLFEVAGRLGGIQTLLMVVLTAAIGVQVAKQQRFSTLLRANDRIRQGQLPAQEIIEGMLLAAAGAAVGAGAALLAARGRGGSPPPARAGK